MRDDSMLESSNPSVVATKHYERHTERGREEIETGFKERKKRRSERKKALENMKRKTD